MNNLKKYALKIGSGFTPKGGKESYCKSGVALIRSQNVLDLGMSKNGLAYITDSQASKMKYVEVQEGDVLLNITGDSVARVCVVAKSLLPARVNQHVAIIRVKQDELLPTYLQYQLYLMKKHLLQIASSNSTRNALTKEIIGDLYINPPDMFVQQRIVEILDVIQRKIELNTQINDNLAA